MDLITIRRVNNGYVLISKQDDEQLELVFEVKLEGDKEVSVRDLLHAILDELGMTGSRHDAKRIYVKVAPGEKHDNFKDEHEILIGD